MNILPASESQYEFVVGPNAFHELSSCAIVWGTSALEFESKVRDNFRVSPWRVVSIEAIVMAGVEWVVETISAGGHLDGTLGVSTTGCQYQSC